MSYDILTKFVCPVCGEMLFAHDPDYLSASVERFECTDKNSDHQCDSTCDLDAVCMKCKTCHADVSIIKDEYDRRMKQ